MMRGNPPDLSIHYLAHSLASDVIGFAASQLSKMANGADKETMKSWGKDNMAIFMEVYLDHLNTAYKSQIKSIKKLKGVQSGESDTL